MTKYASYIVFLLISILVATFYVNGFGPIESLQSSINDKLQNLTASDEMVQNVVIVTIDGAAQDQYGSWPWGHDRIADLTAAIAGANPKVIVLDFELQENAAQEKAGNTKILTEQLSWIDNLVIPYDIALATFRSSRTSNPDYLFDYSLTVNDQLGIMEENSSLLTRKLFLPAAKILKTRPKLGFSYIMPDDDRILRHQSMVMNYEGYYYPSVALMAAAVYEKVLPDMVKITEGQKIELGSRVTIPINEKSEFFLNFYKENPFVKYSASQILGEGFNFGQLAGKAVLITVDKFENSEYFKTPVSDESPRYMITATTLSNLINRDMITIGFNSILYNLLLLFLLGGICAFVMPQISLLYRFVTLGIGLFLLINVNYFMLSSFNVLVELSYIGLEFVLFMAAAPMLETSLVLGEEAEEIRKKKAKEKAKKRMERLRLKAKSQSDGAESDEPVVREIKASSSDPENVVTAVLSGEEIKVTSAIEHDGKGSLGGSSAISFNDHQSLNLDGDDSSDDDSEKARGLSQKIKLDSEPEIIDPMSLDNAAAEEDEEDTRTLVSSDDSFNSTPQPADITKLGRYEVSGLLGKGAMGQVYMGKDPAINRPIALKTIRLDFVTDKNEMAELKERLHREAQAAGRLSHPNIVTIYDVGSEGDLQYIAMEYLEGQTLEEMIKRKVKFNYRIIAQIIVQICAAMDYAHKQGIVHRDIKPANIMIRSDYRVKVMDFGIARVESSSMTKTGIAMGTPNYISPEQLKGQQVDNKADIFSLGVVMYEMLLGKRPFKGENITSLIYSIIHTEPEKPSSINPQIPLLFDHIVLRALKKDPKERYQNALEITSDLSDFVDSFTARKH
ncbi:MAG: protein kinase [candidate division Zixibacteria bacterium]|nr:protein kinase [candidate division Zixibacteria bacterium]